MPARSRQLNRARSQPSLNPMPPPPTQPGPRIRRAHRSLHTHRLVELALDQPELRCSCSRFASNSARPSADSRRCAMGASRISPLLQQACLAAKIKGLTELNKTHAGNKATNKRLHPRHPRSADRDRVSPLPR